MRFLKITRGKISPAVVEQMTLDIIRQEIGGHAERCVLHVGLNNRCLIMYINEDARLQDQYRNFIWRGLWISGHAVVVAEKRSGSYINMSDHEMNSIKMLNNELVSLMPTHTGYHAKTPRKESE